MLVGTALCGHATRRGRLRISPSVSTTVAMISAAAPYIRQPGSATTRRPVFLTDRMRLATARGNRHPRAHCDQADVPARTAHQRLAEADEIRLVGNIFLHREQRTPFDEQRRI